MLGASPDLLVGGEGDPDRSVEVLGVVGEPRHQGHDLGYAGLVVGAEQGGAVGRHHRVAHAAREVGVVGGADDLSGVAGQADVTAVVVLDDLGCDAGPEGGEVGVDVGQ